MMIMDKEEARLEAAIYVEKIRTDTTPSITNPNYFYKHLMVTESMKALSIQLEAEIYMKNGIRFF